MLGKPIVTNLDPSWICPEKRFCHPDWEAIHQFVEARFTPEVFHEAYCQMASLWISQIQSQLPPGYNILESNKFIILSRADQQTVVEALQFLESCLFRIHSSLPFVPAELGYGKWPVLCLEVDDFYAYLTDYFNEEEAEHALVGGVFLNRGYGHFAVPDACLERYSSVFAHELTHAILSICDLPNWLDEAITATVEQRITNEIPYVLNRELIGRHRAYWTPDNIQTLWAGTSFWSPDEGQELSYHLSRFIFTALYQSGTIDPSRVSQFIANARREDAGQASAKEHLNLDLGEILSHLLGDGTWAPSQEAMATHWLVKGEGEND